MAVLTQLLQALGLVAGPTTVSASPASRLVLSWPPNPTPMVQGSVVSPSGALDRADSPHPRVVAFLAPETTLRGLGETVATWLHSIAAPSQPIPTALTVTHAVMAYNEKVLDLKGATAVLSGAVPGPILKFPAWEVGRGVRLPVELDASGRPTTDVATWVALAARTGPVAQAWDALVDLTPRPLSLPDHAADIAAAAAVVSGHAHVADAAGDVRTSLLTNPSKALYETLALLAEADAAPAGEQTAFATALVGTALSPDELALLATTLPGAVVLRALYRRLVVAAGTAGHAPAVDAAVTALNQALGIGGTGPADLGTTTPTVVPSELPVSAGWSVRPDVTKNTPRDLNLERLDGRHDLVQGRAIYGGKLASIAGYRGPSYKGNAAYETSKFVSNHAAEVTGGADARRLARLAIVEAIGPNEGYLDSVRLLDAGIMSIGVQQWTVHVDNELDVLLWVLAQNHPDDYDAHLGIYGLRLKLTASWPVGTRGFPQGAPRTVTQARGVPGAANVPMPAPVPAPAQPPDRLHFFEGAADPSHPGNFVFDHTRWAGRTRSAVLCSRALQLLEINTAVGRFDRILAEGKTWTVAGHARTVDQLVTSTQGAAQLLDQHINVPGHVEDDIKTAIAHTAVTPAADANGLTDAWLTAFEAQYLVAVRYGPQTSGVFKIDFHDPNPPHKLLHRGRQSYILSKGFSTTPHSFAAGW
jgi:hypothetical protein